MAKTINEIGNIYGKLTVIERAENSKAGKARWLCKCECGKTKIIVGSDLRNNKTKSCGCEQLKGFEQNHIIKNLTNQRFGKLIALYPVKKNDKIYWHCVCDCGNEKDILGVHLSNESIKSCGCLKMSHGELKINEILTQNNINFIQEYRPKDFSIGFDARFDFYLPELNLLIEYDGKQHFTDKNTGWGESLKNIQKRDSIKTQWALNNGIQIIRIPYTHYDELCIKDLMPETSDFILHKKIQYISRKRE